MKYVLVGKDSVKYPYSIEDMKMDNPGTSFPDVIGGETLSEFGVYPVYTTQAPEVDHTKNVKELAPIFDGEIWSQFWSVEDASDEEKEYRIQSAWSNLRSERNRRLSECDWTQIDDSPVDKIIWAAYRQSLRDLPENTTDPMNPVWPVPPT